MNGSITFVGAGPGAPDLLTLRGAEMLRRADTVIYAGSLIDGRLLEFAPAAEYRNSAKMTLPEVLELMIADYRAGKRVVRLHTGDPAVYGAVSEQYRALDEAGIPYEIVPGVSSVFAAAAALKVELTMPELSQSVILTRIAGRTPVPERESVTRLAAHGTTLCVFLSVGALPELCAQLRAAGRPGDTPAAVVYRAGWENETVVRGTVADIAERVERAGIKRQAMIVIGEILNRNGALSRLYDAHFATGYRHHRFRGSAAVFALTRQAAFKGAEIAAGLDDAMLFVPEKYASGVPESRRRVFKDGAFTETLRENWRNFDAFIFVMASGIAVRAIAPLCFSKQTDPAAVVCDERGDYAISLLSGHTGGANDLARDTARITGGKPVITTASDVAGLPAFDEFARKRRARIVNPEALTAVAAAAVDGRSVSLELPARLFDADFAGNGQFRLAADRHDGTMRAVVENHTLELKLPHIALGVGCRRGVPAERIREVAAHALEAADLDFADIAALGSATIKSDEPGLLEFAAELGVEPRFFPPERLNAVPVPNPSETALRRCGVRSVSEAAALLAAGDGAVLILEKYKERDVTVAIAEVRP